MIFSLLPIMQYVIHYGLHIFLPGVCAWIFFRNNWKMAWVIMLSTMLVDLDHLLARPIYDPTRCSIHYHPLHSEYAIIVYVLLILVPKTRIIGLGLLLHMLTDSLDCFMSLHTGNSYFVHIRTLLSS